MTKVKPAAVFVCAALIASFYAVGAVGVAPAVYYSHIFCAADYLARKNTARNLLRKDRSREEAELRLGIISLRGGIPQEVSVERILAAIEKLPETQRDVLHLKVRSELSDGEIASLLGIQGNTYRKRLQRGRENLLLMIQEEEVGKC